MEGTLYLPLNQIKYNQLIMAFTQNWQLFEWRTRVVAEMSRYPLLLGQATTTVVQRLQQIDFEYATSYWAPPAATSQSAPRKYRATYVNWCFG